MKTVIRTLSFLLVAGVVLAGTPVFAQEFHLRFAHYAAENHPTGQAAFLFAKMVEERTKGRVKVSVFPNNALGSPPQIAEQVKLGSVDMSLNTSGQLLQWAPEFAAVQLPYIYDDYPHVHRVLDGEGGKLLAEKADKIGFVILSHWEWGFRNITNSKRPIRVPEDLKGLKLRIPPELPMEAAMKALGAIPQAVSFAELYMALAQGVVDGQENPIHTIYTHRFYEQQKYLAVTRYMYNNSIHLVSKKTWDRLPADVRNVLKEASDIARDASRKKVMEEEEDILAKMQKAGVTVTYPDPKPFRQLMAPAIDRIAKFAGEAFTRQWLEVTERARKK